MSQIPQDPNLSPIGAVPPLDPPIHPVTPPMVLALKQTRPWVLFLAILGFVFAGLAVVGGLVFGAFMGLAGSMAGGTDKLPAGMGMVMGLGLGALYCVIGVLYFFPSLYLFRFASGIATMLGRDAVGGLEAALRAQKSFWKFAGIATITILGLYILVIFAVILVAGLAAVRSMPGF